MSILKTREAFFSAAHQYISGALFEMAKNEEAVDVLTLANALKKSSELVQAGGEVYLLELMNSVPSTANFDKYLDIVQDASVLRRLIRRSSETLESCLQDDASAGAVLDQLHKEVIDISDNLFKEESVALKDELDAAMGTRNVDGELFRRMGLRIHRWCGCCRADIRGVAGSFSICGRSVSGGKGGVCRSGVR